MNLYKAYLNNEYKLISYGIPDKIEAIPFSESTYDISFEDIRDYIELFGYIKIPYKLLNGISYLFYIDLDYNIIDPFGEQIVMYVSDQIKSRNRKKAIDELFHNLEEKEYEYDKEVVNNFLSEDENRGIIGNDVMEVGNFTYLYHKIDGGEWFSSNSEILEIDKNNGLLYCKSTGIAVVTYKVNSNNGFLKCFKTIIINERKEKN